MSSNTIHQTIVEQAIDYMKQNLERELTTREIAQMVGYSEYHFIRIFKGVTGISPRHFLSALRIEAGKKKLLQPSNSLLNTVLSLGFLSMGSFSNRFKQYVGISPIQFRKTSQKLAENLQIEQEMIVEEERSHSIVSCTIHYPETFKGIIFVGLFPRPIPDQRPLKGTAFRQGRNTCRFSDVPPGDYYVLAAGIPRSMNPKAYYLLENCLRAKTAEPIHVNHQTTSSVTLSLREPFPFDPPILVNLPLLFFESQQQDSKVGEKMSDQ